MYDTYKLVKNGPSLSDPNNYKLYREINMVLGRGGLVAVRFGREKVEK